MGIPSGELTSVDIKEAMIHDVAARAAALRAEGHPAQFVLVSAHPEHEPSQKYMGLKTKQARKIGIVAHRFDEYTPGEAEHRIKEANESPNIHGTVLQLPLRPDEVEFTSGLVNLISPEKDVDGLREDGTGMFTPATPNAIIRLLEGHSVDLSSELITVVGLGKLVGRPLIKHLEDNGADVMGVDLLTPADRRLEAINDATVVISAMGAPGLLTPSLFTDMSQPRVLVDAGTAEHAGEVVGDVSPELREAALQNGWAVSAAKGSVGPLTVISLLENVVSSAEHFAATA